MCPPPTKHAVECSWRTRRCMGLRAEADALEAARGPARQREGSMPLRLRRARSDLRERDPRLLGMRRHTAGSRGAGPRRLHDHARARADVRDRPSPRGTSMIVFAAMVLIALVALPAEAQQGPTQMELNAAASNAVDWLHTNHDYGGQRFVDAKDINRENAHLLQ